ncbi:hypothetical protein RRG08_002941 [Elysia crispata]|uniref:Uncharacterized protein n=1 Tax=Elysia crispata TaxID=231223 RepID=A0AAE1AQS2_9GAST|nr:hypothetical protein RRG08_002941 [Elysia crispata]
MVRIPGDKEHDIVSQYTKNGVNGNNEREVLTHEKSQKATENQELKRIPETVWGQVLAQHNKRSGPVLEIMRAQTPVLSILKAVLENAKRSLNRSTAWELAKHR